MASVDCWRLNDPKVCGIERGPRSRSVFIPAYQLPGFTRQHALRMLRPSRFDRMLRRGITIVAVLHHRTAASDGCDRDYEEPNRAQRYVKSDNAFCCVVAAVTFLSNPIASAVRVPVPPGSSIVRNRLSKVDQVSFGERHSDGVHYCRQVNDLLQDGSLKRRQVPKCSRNHTDDAGHHSSDGALQCD